MSRSVSSLRCRTILPSSRPAESTVRETPGIQSINPEGQLITNCYRIVHVRYLVGSNKSIKETYYTLRSAGNWYIPRAHCQHMHHTRWDSSLYMLGEKIYIYVYLHIGEQTFLLTVLVHNTPSRFIHVYKAIYIYNVLPHIISGV